MIGSNFVGIEKVLKLANRMSKISSAELQFETDEDYETQTVHEESQMTLFFQIFNAFKGNKKVLRTAEFSNKNSTYQIMSQSNGVINIDYGLKYQYMHGNSQDDARSDFELILYNKTASNIGSEIFNCIKFYLSTINDGLLTYKILKYSLTNCPHPQYVEFEEVNGGCSQLYLSTSSIRPDS